MDDIIERKRNELNKQAHRNAPKTLGFAGAAGTIGALIGGPAGALVGVVIGGTVGYFADTA